MAVRDVKELTVYIKAYQVAMDFFEISKLSDCIGENWETDTAVDFARDCGYINPDVHTQLISVNTEVGKMLRSMHDYPEKFLISNP